MKIVNTIGWRTPWIRRAIGYCCKELDYPASRLKTATFCQAHLRAGGRGLAYLEMHAIKVKINPLNVYPNMNRAVRDLPAHDLADAIELFLLLTAHEIAHLERWDRFARKMALRGERDTLCERDTEFFARKVLESFRRDRPALLAQWGEAGDGPRPPDVLHKLTCPKCGRSWQHARLISGMKKRFCVACNLGWKQGMPNPEPLVYERVQAG